MLDRRYVLESADLLIQIGNLWDQMTWSNILASGMDNLDPHGKAPPNHVRSRIGREVPVLQHI